MDNGLPPNTLAWVENDGGVYTEFRSIAPNAQTIMHALSADLDVDGDLDIIAARPGEGSMEWYANDGTGDFSGPEPITSSCDSTFRHHPGDRMVTATRTLSPAQRIVSWFGSGP
ncbi:MAG: VCBS repeat-containing protein [Flavobacteriales bacterium]|nr:VCBS repeat-containing protein [Flavobacteriales bacterium]